MRCQRVEVRCVDHAVVIGVAQEMQESQRCVGLDCQGVGVGDGGAVQDGAIIAVRCDAIGRAGEGE